jgi:hypothetical protein
LQLQPSEEVMNVCSMCVCVTMNKRFFEYFLLMVNVYYLKLENI